ncbi:hypothetical protein [Polyangium aurulentum]|uniref:hypothetical protein n=1 Tax=Polyangium aurulentum TaxID=2567896 RepID=UPI00201010AD|nr:hypothetical protein [Polyangium aurulentum]UQA59696.1 hypothetical protein E8A73_004105 [Polyangium aurulentum]
MTHPAALMTPQEARKSSQAVVIAFGGFAALWALLGLVALVGTLYDLGQGGEVPTVALLAVPVLFFLSLLMGFISARERKRMLSLRRIEERPVVAWATLDAFSRGNATINKKRLYYISLTVTPQHEHPYAAETLWFFPLDLRDVLQPGARLVVCIDPEDPSFVVVDWNQTRASWAAPQR